MRSQQTPRINRKHNEVSGSVQKIKEVQGSSRKPLESSGRHDIKIIINKQTKYSGSEAISKL